MLRAQLPVRSPLSAGAIAGGLMTLVGPARYTRRTLQRVERELLDRYDGEGILLLDGGTSALMLALRGAAQQSGDRRPVALPAYSCFDLATAAVGADVDVLLYDIEPETLAPSPASLERVLEGGPAAVVVAPLYGIPVDLTELADAIRRSGALLVEDAAQAAGASIHGRGVGTLGDLTVLSFGRGKGVTGGSGGALLSRGATPGRILEGARRTAPDPVPRGTADWLKATATWLLGRPSIYGLPASLPFLGLGETEYRRPADPSRMTASAAGILDRTLGAADTETAARRKHAARLLEVLATAAGDGIRPVATPKEARPGFLRLPVLLTEAARASGAVAAGRRMGIMPGYPASLDTLEPLQERMLNLEEGTFTGAQHLAERLVTLPTHGGVSETDFGQLERWIRNVAAVR